MEFLPIIIVFALALAALPLTRLAVQEVKVRYIRKMLDKVSRSYGLSLRRGFPFFGHLGTMEGKIDGHPIRLTMSKLHETTTTKMIIGGIDPSVSLRKESLTLRIGLTFERWLGGNSGGPYSRDGDILTGDEGFDLRIDVRGPMPFCLAALDKDGRKSVLLVIQEWDGLVQGGEISLKTDRDLSQTGELKRFIRQALNVATIFQPCSPEEVRNRLIDNYREEDNPRVRTALLAALGVGFAGDSDSLAISRAALKRTGNGWMRVQAAANLGPEGVPHLQAILRDPHKDDAVHARCVRILGAALPEAEAEALLLEHLVDSRHTVAFAAAESFGAKVGTAKAVPLLTETADHHASADVRKAAQKALDAIAVKLEGVEPGGLALAPAGEDGQLSRADAAQPPLRDISSERTWER